MNSAPLSISSEQINSLPLLVGVLDELGIRQALDAQIRPHGQWEGISPGTLLVIWLAHILQERDHRMVSLRDWAASRAQSLSRLLGIVLRETDCTDDRLAQLLTMLGPEARQQALDQVLVSDWIRVYRLPCEVTRLDSTTCSVYHEPDESDESDEPAEPPSLLQRGLSQDHRPDLRQFKVMLATLDPLGLPLAAQTVAGNCSDDPLYIPAYEAVVAVLGTRDVLVVGDSKMGALATRGHLVARGSTYLCAYRPPAASARLAAWVERALAHPSEWTWLTRTDPRSGESRAETAVYTFTHEQAWQDPATRQLHTWSERVLLAQTPSVQAGLRRRREETLARVAQRLAKLMQPLAQGRRRYASQADLQAKLTTLLAEADGLDWAVVVHIETALFEGTSARGKPMRSWGVASFWVDLVAWQAAVARLGWQVYLTNTTPEQYDLAALVQRYHQQAIHERGFSRLKTRNLQIRPVYVRDEVRIAGLVWVLCLALRVLTLVEYRLRTALAERGEQLAGLNPASRRQATARPTTERVITAFANITLTRVELAGAAHWHVTPLTATQQHVLELLKLPRQPYAWLVDAGAAVEGDLRE